MFASAMLVMQFDAPVLGYGAPGRTAAWLLIQALLMGALPVCLPLFIAGFVRHRTKETGGGLAIAGLVLGYVAVVAGVAALMGTWFVGILFLKVVG